MHPSILSLFAASLILFFLRLLALPHMPPALPAALAGTALLMLIISAITFVIQNYREIVAAIHEDDEDDDMEAATYAPELGVADPDDEDPVFSERQPTDLCPVCGICTDHGCDCERLTNEEFLSKTTTSLKQAFANSRHVTSCHPRLQCSECLDAPTAFLPRTEDRDPAFPAHALRNDSPTIEDLAFALYYTHGGSMDRDRFKVVFVVREFYINEATRRPIDAKAAWDLQQSPTARMAPVALLMLGNVQYMDVLAFGIMGFAILAIILGCIYALGYYLGSRDTSEAMKTTMATTRASLLTQGTRQKELT